MAIYEYSCKECRIIWECEYPFAKQESKTSCPKCEVACGQHWHGRDIPVHYKGEGWSQPTGHHKIGGADEGNLKLQDGSRDRMATGWQNYSRYEPSEDWVKENKGRRLNDKEINQKLDASRKLSATVYDKAQINPYDKYKPQ